MAPGDSMFEPDFDPQPPPPLWWVVLILMGIFYGTYSGAQWVSSPQGASSITQHFLLWFSVNCGR